MSKLTTMSLQNKWRLRGRRNTKKACVHGSQFQQHILIPNPILPPKPYRICPVSEHIIRIDTRIYELLTIFTDRLTRLQYYVCNMSERLKRDRYQRNNLSVQTNYEVKFSKVKLKNLLEIRMMKLEFHLIIICG